MRKSRTSVGLRAALLLVGGAYMIWRGWANHAAVEAGAGSSARMLALVQLLAGALCVATAAGAALMLRRRRGRKPTLRLGGSDRARRQ